MRKILFLLLLTAVGVRAGCSTLSLPTDYLTVAGISRANLAGSFAAVRDARNCTNDSTTAILGVLSGFNSNLQMRSLGDLHLRLDSDDNGTSRFVVTNGGMDSLLRIGEDSTARFFGPVTIPKLTLSDSILAATARISGLTASRLMATNAGSTLASVADLTSWVAGTANQITATSDGDGSITLSLATDIATVGDLIAGDEIIMTPTASAIRSNTSDGADTKRIAVGGGGGISDTRGGRIDVNGNEHASTPGQVRLIPGTGSTIEANGVVNATSRLNVGGATDNASFYLNVSGGSIGLSGANSILGYGSGVPGDANYERISLIHTGSAAELRSQAGGTGTVEPLRLVVGSTTRYEITDAGAHAITGAATFSSNVTLGGTLVVTGVQTNAQDLVFSASRAIRRDVQTGSIDFSGGNSASDGANIALFGSTHATLANNWRIRHGTTNTIAYDGTSLSIGNATTNPAIQLLGSGTKTIDGTINTDLTASRTVVTDGSGNLSVNTETGTGSHVKATSPTLVTPTLGVASATSIALGGGEAFVYGDTSFTVTGTGFSGSVTATAYGVKIGRLVTIHIVGLSGTSNATSFTITGIPSGWQPANISTHLVLAQDGSVETIAVAQISGGTITLSKGVPTGAWGSTGTKGIFDTPLTYQMQ